MRKPELMSLLYETDRLYGERTSLGEFDANSDVIKYALWAIRELTKHAIEKEAQIQRLSQKDKSTKPGSKGVAKGSRPAHKSAPKT